MFFFLTTVWKYTKPLIDSSLIDSLVKVKKIKKKLGINLYKYKNSICRQSVKAFHCLFYQSLNEFLCNSRVHKYLLINN